MLVGYAGAWLRFLEAARVMVLSQVPVGLSVISLPTVVVPGSCNPVCIGPVAGMEAANVIVAEFRVAMLLALAQVVDSFRADLTMSQRSHALASQAIVYESPMIQMVMALDQTAAVNDIHAVPGEDVAPEVMFPEMIVANEGEEIHPEAKVEVE